MSLEMGSGMAPFPVFLSLLHAYGSSCKLSPTALVRCLSVCFCAPCHEGHGL